MPAATTPTLDWVLLTMGDRPAALHRAIESLRRSTPAPGQIIVVSNGAGDLGSIDDDLVTVIESPENLGVPGGRDLGAAKSGADIIGFLDDDAELLTADLSSALSEFSADALLAVVTLRLLDEDGETARRHTPRPGAAASAMSGAVAVFLGGASLVRAAAYRDAGGYFTELVYAHEELELSWRLVDRGWGIRYLADVEVFHPRTEISRHPGGWERTGRNRVLIARHTLPWPIALVHAAVWAIYGAMRTPDAQCRQGYLRGWWGGWWTAVEHRPIRWRTVGALARLGRPPVI